MDNGKHSFLINLFEPRRIRQLVGAAIYINLVLLLLIAFAPNHSSGWLKLNLIVMGPYILASIIFVIFARKLIIDFYLYLAFSILLFSLNCLFLGLAILVNSIQGLYIVFGIIYALALLVAFIMCEKTMVMETEGVRSGKHKKEIFFVAIAAVGTSVGMLVSRTSSYDFGSFLAGLAFLFSAIGSELGIAHALYKWRLVKKSGYKA